jgi:hypothetical protein
MIAFGSWNWQKIRPGIMGQQSTGDVKELHFIRKGK